MRISVVHLYWFILACPWPGSTLGDKRQLGHNCFPRRSMHGACDVDSNGDEMACLMINGYFQCAPALEEGQRCGVGNRYNECRHGLWCSGAGGECRTAPAVGAACAGPISLDARNVCGYLGFCDPSTSLCREYITSTVDFEDSCTPNTDYGYHECAPDLTCEYHWNQGNSYGTCVERFQENDGKSCGDQDCADGLMCYFWDCVPLSHRGERCRQQYDCVGNLRCEPATNTCQLRSESDPSVTDIVPTRAPTNEPTKRPTFPPTPDPTQPPSKQPTPGPTQVPSEQPTLAPTRAPSKQPTPGPSQPPSKQPTPRPSRSPSKHPTLDPTAAPTDGPTTLPPTANPTPTATTESVPLTEETLPDVNPLALEPTQSPSEVAIPSTSSSNGGDTLQATTPAPTSDSPAPTPGTTVPALIPGSSVESSSGSPPTDCKPENLSIYDRLPVLDDNLGHGFNAVTGERTTGHKPVLELPYTQGCTLHITTTDKKYLIPDHDAVYCEHIPRTNYQIITEAFTSTESYRRDLGGRLGIDSSLKKFSYLKLSAAYRNVIDQRFGEDYYLYKAYTEVDDYNCKLIIPTSEKKVTSAVNSAVQLSDDTTNLIEETTGTHYITSFAAGGRRDVLVYVHKCVSNESTTHLADIKAAFGQFFVWEVEGEVSAVVEVGCSDFSQNSHYVAETIGGEQISDLSEWTENVKIAPVAIKYSIEPIEDLLPSLKTAVAAYVDGIGTADEDKNLDLQAATECPSECTGRVVTAAPTAAPSGGSIISFGWDFLAAALVVFSWVFFLF